MCAVASGALGRHPYGRHDSRSGLAACEVGQVRSMYLKLGERTARNVRTR